ncbi:MAG: hypothetical protein AB1505_03055 [Candidatus Latescibacterota bacterium]
MLCQIGIYADCKDALDHWSALITVQDNRSPRDMLREIAPFLRQFQLQQDMHDTESLAAWLTWYLIEAGMGSDTYPARVSLDRAIRGDINCFYKVSPGLVEVYSVDELLEWKLIAAVEIDRQPLPVEST